MQLQIDKENIPEHIAVIMDGNGRWAKQRGITRIKGHHNALQAVRDTTEGCAKLGVKHLTLFTFSTENWNRPKAEVDGLMALLVNTIKSEIKILTENNIQLKSIGDVGAMPKKTFDTLQKAIEDTSINDGMELILALNYSGKWDITQAVQKATKQNEPLNFENYLSLSDIPDPELLIRTSGEMRISNFMLWQMAYTELHFTDVLWPDFRLNDLNKAIHEYQTRERRFGKTSEQL